MVLLDEQVLLDLIAVHLDSSIRLKDDVGQLFKHFDLLRRYEVAVTGPNVVKRKVVFEVGTLKASILQDLLRLPRRMVQIHEAHVVDASILQENVLWSQVCVDDVLLMEHLQHINNLYRDLNRFKLTE